MSNLLSKLLSRFLSNLYFKLPAVVLLLILLVVMIAVFWPSQDKKTASPAKARQTSPSWNEMSPAEKLYHTALVYKPGFC